jgi:sec-independent protein translocase protein TatA
MPFGISAWELVILMVLLLLIFGARRLPEMGRSIGYGMREFKDAITGKDASPEKTELSPPPQEQPAATPPAAQPSETERVSR